MTKSYSQITHYFRPLTQDRGGGRLCDLLQSVLGTDSRLFGFRDLLRRALVPRTIVLLPRGLSANCERKKEYAWGCLQVAAQAWPARPESSAVVVERWLWSLRRLYAKRQSKCQLG